ncbi:hypothetical protein SBRY_140086 [Actinacidiphila bryophytorum]|uniref:Uncharacterized protein n=1 Tax=Actinacidiphila bryophytorum TaxID=1436133 RepID=A0A9W4E6E1_9ACTN|nr:hypothetical protein SBRY_140086 [Actinacidiphila bryophytorum]
MRSPRDSTRWAECCATSPAPGAASPSSRRTPSSRSASWPNSPRSPPRWPTPCAGAVYRNRRRPSRPTRASRSSASPSSAGSAARTTASCAGSSRTPWPNSRPSPPPPDPAAPHQASARPTHNRRTPPRRTPTHQAVPPHPHCPEAARHRPRESRTTPPRSGRHAPATRRTRNSYDTVTARRRPARTPRAAPAVPRPAARPGGGAAGHSRAGGTDARNPAAMRAAREKPASWRVLRL